MVEASFSRRELSKYAAAAALLSLAPLGATLDGRKASADNPRLIDFAERRIAPAEIKSAGYAGVVNYVSEARPGADFEAKPHHPGVRRLVARGGFAYRQQLPIRQAGGTAPSDFTRGFDGGVADAHTALRLHSAAGGSDSAPIFFSVDDDIDMPIPGTVWPSTGFAASIRYWALREPGFTDIFRLASGRPTTA